MARTPNYRVERNSRAKAKADKREAKRLAKLATKAEKEEPGTDPEAGQATAPADGETGDPGKPVD